MTTDARTVRGDMRGVPGDLTTSTRPPTTIPLRHFLVALAFLAAGGALALTRVVGIEGAGAGLGRIAAAHLLLVGWVCLTVLGAMTQFVPVWSGVELHSDRLATLQLVAVAVGVSGFAGGLWIGRPADAALFAGLILLGFAAFVYNLARTLWRARPLDVTEGHFALALGFLALAAVLGGSLAADYRWGVLAPLGLSRTAVVDAHVTLAVLGVVVTTVFGALYQLGPMFTQTDALPVEDRLARVETAAYPAGVTLLAAGRLLSFATLATAGGLLAAGGAAVAGGILLRRLRDATATATPMLSRYAVVAVATLAWSATAAATWTVDPLGPAVRFGHPAVGPVLLGALVGFVVVGSLYHVVPFIVWLDRYADRVGLERVPAIDDLYHARVAAVDLAATVLGAGLLLAAAVSPAVASVGAVGGSAEGLVRPLGGALVVAGALLFAGNMVATVVRHGGTAIFGGVGSAATTPSEATDADDR
ncbi:cbb3-type cytochrome c oxidase subunit I [Halorubrum sp. Ea8]|uniref:cbb3-type cytochrome c oxidase subunit I n=1 Tax=Halorubrum sp. Ea8 TaxID=1383841 RepID=UPI001C3C6213|nr:cbb3-type cytochrome c oxidase subunit I [Halorubrum sp. Ea8]